MKKSNLILALSLLLFFAACGKKEQCLTKTDWQNDELVGNVKSYRIVNFMAGIELGEVVKGDTLGAVGRIVYNESGFRTNEYWLFNHEESRRIYTYSEDGKCTSSIYRRANGEMEERCESKYNKQGFLEEDCYYRANGELLTRVEYTFDEEGNLTEQRIFNSENEMEERHVSKYTSEGFESEHQAYYYEGNNSMLTKQKNKYKNGLLIEADLYGDGGSLLGHWSYQYDEHNNIIVEESRDGEEEIAERRIYEYEYDSTGNWVKRTTFDFNGEENEPRVIAERQIEYF